MMTKRFGIVAMFVSLSLSQAACVAESSDDGTGDEVNSEESAVTTSNANICVNKILALRNTVRPALTAATNVNAVAITNRNTSTHGGCSALEAAYDSTHGAHAAHNGNVYQCLGVQNECVNWSQGSKTVQQLVESCVQAWFNEGPGTDYSKHGHYNNMTSTTYKFDDCGVYQNPTTKAWTITADFHAVK